MTAIFAYLSAAIYLPDVSKLNIVVEKNIKITMNNNNGINIIDAILVNAILFSSTTFLKISGSKASVRAIYESCKYPAIVIPILYKPNSEKCVNSPEIHDQYS